VTAPALVGAAGVGSRKAEVQHLDHVIRRDFHVGGLQIALSTRSASVSSSTRSERASREERIEGWRPTRSEPDMPRPKNELPQHVPDHMKLMLDLIVLAFQMDKTRIATVMLNNDLSQMNFKFLEGVQGALHLDLTHNGHAPDKEAMYLKTNQYHIAQFAYLTKRMKEISEGEPSLLDNSILMCNVEPVRRRRDQPPGRSLRPPYAPTACSCAMRKSTTFSNGSKPNADATDGRRFEFALMS